MYPIFPIYLPTISWSFFKEPNTNALNSLVGAKSSLFPFGDMLRWGETPTDNRKNTSLAYHVQIQYWATPFLLFQRQLK